MPQHCPRLIDLIHDPICLTLMKRDGVDPVAVLRLMKSVKPLISQNDADQMRAAWGPLSTGTHPPLIGVQC